MAELLPELAAADAVVLAVRMMMSPRQVMEHLKDFLDEVPLPYARPRKLNPCVACPQCRADGMGLVPEKVRCHPNELQPLYQLPLVRFVVRAQSFALVVW